MCQLGERSRQLGAAASLTVAETKAIMAPPVRPDTPTT
eukprot:COSAG01_NODE_14702_length_1420_cov_1.769114_3_plen_37_part_01